MYCWALNG